MFIVSITYTKSLNIVDKYVVAHRAFLDEQYAAGILLASGRKEPRDGGILIANAKSRKELEKILSQDPFQIQNLAKYDIIEFIPRKTSAELAFLCQ